MISNIRKALVAATAISGVLAAPARQPATLEERQSSSGSLYGGEGLIGYNSANAIDTPDTVIPTSDFELAPGQTEDPKLGLYLNLQDVKNPQPIRGNDSAPTDPGPRTYEYEKLNSDLYAPPATDSGSVPNGHWPLGLSHNRHGTPASAGWARQQNEEQLPVATAMAGVDMRLEPNAYRELHWHSAGEWSLILAGSVRVAAMNENGETFIDDLKEGDVWFFPPGVPHSIQAGVNGTEFLLIFDQGNFDESDTALVTELLLRNPLEVLAKDLETDVSAFDDMPDDQLYIFPGTPFPEDIKEQNITGPAGSLPHNRLYSYHFSEQEPMTVPGGSIKLLDSTVFPIASNFAVALVTIEPGAMREIHWHLTSDEWNYFLQGQARATIFAAPESSQTFDFSAGDVGYIPVTDAHYVENTGNETVVFLEVLQAPRFTDISVAQWLSLTPPKVVEETVHIPASVLSKLPKTKTYIKPGNKNLLTTNFTTDAS